MKIVLGIGTIVLMVALTGCVFNQPEQRAFVAVASSAKVGGMKITSIDGKAVTATDGHYVEAGIHEFRVACQLDNGVGTTFAFETELDPAHSYCFASRDQGRSCTIIYSRVSWEGGGRVLCQ